MTMGAEPVVRGESREWRGSRAVGVKGGVGVEKWSGSKEWRGSRAVGVGNGVGLEKWSGSIEWRA